MRLDDPPLFVQFAVPSDEDPDDFTSGNAEVDNYFSSRKWFDFSKNEPSPPTYQFRTGEKGDVVGYAAVALEKLAREKPGCVGLYLWVRSDNPRAIAFYEKIGFKRDPGGPCVRDDKAPHITMRKTR